MLKFSFPEQRHMTSAQTLAATATLLPASNLFITLAVFVPFAILYMGQSLKWDYLWAGLCLMGAVYFIFRA